MLLIKRLKEGITTIIGLLLLAGSAFLLYQGKITMGEFTAFLPVCIGLFWAKNSFITDMFKGGGGTAAILVILITLSGCRTTRHAANPSLPSTISSSSTTTTTSGGETQQGYTKPDSASIKALLKCDSTGQVYLSYIEELMAGNNVKPSIVVKDNYVYLKCTVDSLAVYNKWLRFYNSTTDTITEVKYLPGEVTNELTWFQKLMIKLGWLSVAALLVLALYIVYRIYKPFK